MSSLHTLLKYIQQCQVCAPSLPYPPKPIVRVSQTARILLVGQAPGTRVHKTGIPWNDRSGDRLRQWLELDKAVFYDVTRLAIVPMGFCYPGSGKHGDLPPPPECAQQWREKLHQCLPHIQCTLLVGKYAQTYYLGKRRKKTLTETVLSYQDYFPEYLPFPHPSFRNNAWLQSNPWFTESVLPIFRKHIAHFL